jgi:hypothetical protein
MAHRETGWGGSRLDSSGSGERSVTFCCEHGNEPAVSIEYVEFLEWLSNWWLPKMESATWSYSIYLS